MATLLVVMALFFLVSMVAAYASRNLVFEQRTSANQYRSTQAFEVAEGGVEWALSQLNGGRVDASCNGTANPAAASFRERFIVVDPTLGTVAPVTWASPAGTAPLNPSCVRQAGGWSCSCPAASAPVLDDGGGVGVKPVFRIQFEGTTTPGIFRIRSTGCTANDDNCLRLGRGEGAEAAARVNVTVALAPALAMLPNAAITVRGSYRITGAQRVGNDDAGTNGITIQAGGSVSADAAVLDTAPGTPGGQSIVSNDATLAGLTADRMFVSFFGVSRAAFQRKPTTLSFTCGGGCGERLRDLVARQPGRPIWVTDTLTLDAPVAIGSPAMPALLVLGGGLEMSSAGASITGLVYAQAATWPSAGRGSLQGALLSEGSIDGSSGPDVRYDAAVINRIRVTQGPVVRVPGGWRDF
ncbi:MAG: hypothetical protein JNJ71_15055 [Rubrivivax sp.]|nr:hypothetical protein [Rubrivivax sp.]